MMHRIGLVAVLLAFILVAGVAIADQGDHVPDADFNLNSLNSQPTGITFDGTYFQVANGNIGFDADDSYRYDYEGAVYASYPLETCGLGGSNVRGFTWDGTYIRMVDQSEDEVCAFGTGGVRLTSGDFDLVSDNDDAEGIAFDGTHFWVVDDGDDKVYAYTEAGVYVSSKTFDLVSANDRATGVTWDGGYLRVVDVSADKVFSYTTDGTHAPGQDFELVAANSSPQGITYDDAGPYFRVVDALDHKVYSYEAPSPMEPAIEPVAELEGTVVSHDTWKCIQSQTGLSMRFNNTALTVHGFCAQDSTAAGMEVEIHVAATSKYADLNLFGEVTGEWRFAETTTIASRGVYQDGLDEFGQMGFAEETGGLEDSTRLGFATRAKSYEDDDCVEENTGEGYACERSLLLAMAVGDTAALYFGLASGNSIEDADIPAVPDTLAVTRNSDYTASTITWELYDAVTLYEVQRLTAVTVDVADASRIEYGDPVTVRVESTQEGITETEEDGLQAHRTYQYRVRARGADANSWSAWSEFVFSGSQPEVDLAPPGNFQITWDEDSIIVAWSAPPGDFDNYTLQRQELVIVEGSTFFANVVTLSEAGSPWLPGDTIMYTDAHLIPSQTYEYRLAAVDDDQVGVYSEWFRIAPPNTNLGAAPRNFMLRSAGARILGERREYWMGWDLVKGAEDYEVEVLVFDAFSRMQTMEAHIVTNPLYFRTAYSRVGFRVRGRKLDAETCAAADDDRCLTEWSGWYEVRYTPRVSIPAPPVATPTADTMEIREQTEHMFSELLGAAGGDVEGSRVLQFLVLLLSVGVSGLSIAISWRRGMAALGVGMGAAIFVLILFAGWKLFGTPLAWAVVVQVLIGVAGFFALVRQLGVFR